MSAERVIAERIEQQMPEARRAHVPQQREVQRRYLLSHSLRLTETMAPEAYEAAREAARALGCDDHVELYHSRERSEGHTARLVLHGQPIGIELIGDCLDVFDRTELVAVLGHEIGHCLAHAAHPDFAWVRDALRVGEASARSRRIYSVASELTADRFGLLACRDLHAVLRIEMRGQMGRPPAGLRLDTLAYLEQGKELARTLLARRSVMFGATHPEHYLRGYAAWLFSESEVYASMVASGPATRSIDDVDDVLGKLLGLRQSRSDESERARAVGRASSPRLPLDRAAPSPLARTEPTRAERATGIRAVFGAATKMIAGAVGALTPSRADRPDAGDDRSIAEHLADRGVKPERR